MPTEESWLSADAFFAYRGFTASAYIVADGFQTHDINRDHHGILSDLRVAISEDIGSYVAFTPVHWVLDDLLARLIALESATRVTSAVTADSWIALSGTYGLGIFTADAVSAVTVEFDQLTADAEFILGGSFTANAEIIGLRYLIADAFIIGDW
jgi:hypothetical protein